MADFCVQCAGALFGPEYAKDLAGLIEEEKVKEGYRAAVLCEGCGFIYVDHTGTCQGGPNCLQNHTTIWRGFAETLTEV